MQTANKKLVQLLCAGKGGVGKSVLEYILINKYNNAIALDMDINETTFRQLAYRNPVKVDLLNENQVVDRGRLNDFFEHVSSHAANHFIADCSSSLSEQLIPYMKDFGAKNLAEILETLSIDMQLITIVGGADVFSATMNYASELCAAIDNNITLTIAYNQYFSLLEEQKEQLEKFTAKNNLQLISYTISNDKNQSTQNRIKQVLTAGKGYDNASPFSKVYFQNAVKNIQL